MSYISTTLVKDYDKVRIICDLCNKEYEILYISAKRSIKKRGIHKCQSCAAKSSPKPQNTKEYWTDQRKQDHGLSIKNSDAYYESLKTRDTSGPKNGMYGKRLTADQKAVMGSRLKGKFGVNAIGWKGGKNSLTCRVKGYINRSCSWYFNVYKRDGFKCTRCGSKKKLDAHHIIPIATIIKKLLTSENFSDDSEKFNFLISREEILDPDLKNGMTLCRLCHKQEHQNWGSHYPQGKINEGFIGPVQSL